MQSAGAQKTEEPICDNRENAKDNEREGTISSMKTG